MSTECKLCNLRFYIRKLAVSELKHNVYPLIRENFARAPIFHFVTWLTPRVKGEKATLSAAVAGDQNISPSNMLLWHKDCLKELSRMPKKTLCSLLIGPKKGHTFSSVPFTSPVRRKERQITANNSMSSSARNWHQRYRCRTLS